MGKSTRHTLTLEVPHQVLVDLLVTAVEGGSNYWAHFTALERDSEFNILKVRVSDREDEKRPPQSWEVTPTLLLLGLSNLGARINKKGPESWSLKPVTAAKILGDVLAEEGDALTADAVLQMALFGDLIYG